MEKKILKIIKIALSEDIGSGDITTEATVSGKKKGRAQAIAKDDFIIAGIDVFEETFKILDKNIKVKKLNKDCCRAKKGDVIAESVSAYVRDCHADFEICKSCARHKSENIRHSQDCAGFTYSG
jgi:nicotinate-nucleotide pyrophosphorylase